MSGDKKPQDPGEKLLKTPSKPARGSTISLEYSLIYVQFKESEFPKYWCEMVDLYDINDDHYRKQILAMMQLHEQMWSATSVKSKGFLTALR